VRRLFAADGAATKFRIANTIAEELPEQPSPRSFPNLHRACRPSERSGCPSMPT
jgi:hypothetical protein